MKVLISSDEIEYLTTKFFLNEILGKNGSQFLPPETLISKIVH